jgi:hypothetical protein
VQIHKTPDQFLLDARFGSAMPCPWFTPVPLSPVYRERLGSTFKPNKAYCCVQSKIFLSTIYVDKISEPNTAVA